MRAPSSWRELVAVLMKTVMVVVVEIVVGMMTFIGVVVKEAEQGHRCRRCLPLAMQMCPRNRRA